jgi:hypothetical protein
MTMPTAILNRLRDIREARTQYKNLERELAAYTTADDLNDLDAILDRHSEDETRDIRRVLATKRFS